MGSYYANGPQPPGPNATPKEKAQYKSDMAAYQQTAGPPPAPAPVVPPVAPGGGLPAARITDMTAHGGMIVLGDFTVLIGELPAARVTDMHECPMVAVIVPHVGGPIIPPSSPTVLIGELFAARMSDMATCVGPPDVIAEGDFTVFIGE